MWVPVFSFFSHNVFKRYAHVLNPTEMTFFRLSQTKGFADETFNLKKTSGACYKGLTNSRSRVRKKILRTTVCPFLNFFKTLLHS